MHYRVLAAAIAVLTMYTATAANLTESNRSKTDEIIAQVVEAYGGREVLAAMNTVWVEHQTETIAVGQSLKPTPPWDVNSGSGRSAIDIKARAFATTNSGEGGGFEFHNATVINGDASYQLDYRAELARPIAEPDFDQSSGPFIRVTPALLVRELQAHSRTAHYLGTAMHNKRKHDVIGFSMRVGPAISLYFDQKTRLLTHSERVLPGFGLIEYEFLDYKKIDGVPFNQKFVLRQSGDISMRRGNLRTKTNVRITDELAVAPNLEKTAAVRPDPMTRQEIAKGVHLIGGSGTYGLFVEMTDHVVAIGGTNGARERIGQLREVIADKPIRHAVLTHHHTDHLAALETYIDEGATIFAASAHKKAVVDAAGDRSVSIKTVNARLTLSDGKREIELVDIGPTAHTEHLLVAWLPKERILFEADHFAMPRSGPVGPAVSATRSFAEALQRLALAPKMLVSAHSPRVGQPADLALAVRKADALAGATDVIASTAF